MENDTSILEDEFKQQVILLLKDHEKDFIDKWSENEKELYKVGTETQSKINQYLNKYMDFGKKRFVDLFKRFSNLFLIFVGVISFVFFTAITVWGYDWGLSDETSPYSKFIRMSFVFGVQICFIYIMLSKQRSKLDTEIEHFFNENNVQKNDDYIKELIDNKQSIDTDIKKISGFFEWFKRSLQDTGEVVCSMSSTCEKIDDMNKFKKTWYLECYKVKMVTESFGLNNAENKLDNEIKDLAKKAIIKHKGEKESEIRKAIITSICKKCSINETLMDLFVSYYYPDSSNTNSFWTRVQSDNNQLNQLAIILLDVKELDFAKKANLNTKTLQKILTKTQTFELSLIKNNVLLYLRLCSFLQNYFDKLCKENIPLKNQLNFEEIIDNIEFEGNIGNLDFEKLFNKNFVRMFEEEVNRLLDEKEMHKSLNTDIDTKTKKAYAVALMAIVLNPDINFRKKVCIKASKNDEAVYVLMAYHDLREQKGKKNEHFSLYEIFNKDYAPDKVREKINTDHFSKIKFKHFSTALSEGKWIESTQMILMSMINKFETQLVKNEKNETVIKIFAKYFTQININTLDRAVDAGLFTIYLILVPHTDGNFLTDVIDKLSVSIPKNHYILKKSDSTRTFNYEQIKKCESHYKVSLLFDSDKPLYDFKNYSKATRIGIVDNKIPFTTFVDCFNTAVEMVLRKKVEENPSKKWNVDFIILRISPSKYSFGLMNQDINIKGVEFSSNLNIAKQIAKLASPYLTELQKTAVATFESDIRLENILEELTFFNLMPLNLQKIYEKEYGKLLKSPDLMKSIKECLKTYNINSFRELSDSLFHRPEIQSELEKSLASIISKENIRLENPSLNEEIQIRFASEFLASIKSLYDMWNHEILNL